MSMKTFKGHTQKGSYLFNDTIKQVSKYYDGEYTGYCSYEQAGIERTDSKAKKVECIEALERMCESGMM